MDSTVDYSKRIESLANRAAALLPAVRYAALGSVGMIAGFAPQAQATVVQSTAVNLNVPATTAGLYVNVVTGVSSSSPGAVPGWDINPFNSSILSWFSPSSSVGGAYARYHGAATATPGSLDAGDVIDISSTFTAGVSVFGSGAGEWDLNATNYFGFRFIGEDALLHYGWGTIIVGAAPTSRVLGRLFYESDANKAITIVASSASAVPEPSSIALLLAAGAAGVLAARRRRRQAH